MPHPLEGLITRDDIANVAANEQLILNDDDRISVLEAMRSIDVQACPGSGKTTLIATKLILLAKKWPFQHQGVCVLSHTNVAKNEIIDRLKRSKTIEAQRLLSYPHFIGTIQEFANRFLALPVIRHSGADVRFIDGDDCWKEIYRSGEDIKSLYESLFHKCGGTGRPWPKNNEIYDKIVRQLGSLFWLNSNFDLAFYGDYGSLVTFKNDLTKKVYPKLKALKRALEVKGNFQYRDMFIFAEQLLTENRRIQQVVRDRFPCVFIDEMQDTQKFQDELLCDIFPLDDSNLIVQRFGDPDQAIFHSIGSDEPNESFNGKSRDDMDFVIHNSHRFDGMLAGKIKSLSFNQIPLESELSGKYLADREAVHVTGGNFEHTIIVFNDDTRDCVVEYFAQIVSRQFSKEHKESKGFSVKVVGAVGKDIDIDAEGQLRIGHYWSAYDKAKSQSNFKENTLIEAVYYCRQPTIVDWSGSYKLLIDCVLRLLRMADRKDEGGKYFSATSLRETLKLKGEWANFRECIHFMLNSAHKIDQEFWKGICNVLSAILELKGTTEIAEYLKFGEVFDPEVDANEVHDSVVSLPENKIRHSDGFLIELSTIHGVKGETHDATLIVETKNHIFDIASMLPYLTGELPSADNPNTQLKDKPNSRKANKVFMRQLYVAMSRPKHLLCLAMHSDRLSKEYKEEYKKLLLKNGWKVEVLEPHAEQ